MAPRLLPTSNIAFKKCGRFVVVYPPAARSWRWACMDYIISHLTLSFKKLFAMDLVIVYIFSPSLIFIPHIFIKEIFRGGTSPFFVHGV